MNEYQATFQKNSDTAGAVYSSVRKEFADWKMKYNAEGLKRIAGHSESSTPDELITVPPGVLDRASFPDTHAQADDQPYIYDEEFDEDGNLLPGELVPVTAVKPDFDCTPYPPYQFCTPAPTNMTARMIDNKSAPFEPYPDDPTFPRDEFFAWFQNVQWKDDHRDPDEEIIQYEIVRRLHLEHGLSAEAIDDLMQNYSNFRLLRVSNESGLLWDVSQRDLLNVIWGDGVPSSSKPQLSPHFAHNPAFSDPNDVVSQVRGGFKKFCPNLGCILHNCRIHILPDWKIFANPPALKPPRLASADFFKQPGLPCGEDCFRRNDPHDMEEDLDLSDEVVFLQGFFKLDPNVLPCHIAVFCKIPCRQIFWHRQQFIDDTDVIRTKGKGKRKAKRVIYKSSRKSARKLVPRASDMPPCMHPGACAEMKCNCFKKKIYCARNCRCPSSCPNRFKGCNKTCSEAKTCKKGERCACRLAGRECDPELCTSCDARDAHVHYPEESPPFRTRCHNMELQRPEFKNFEIKGSQYGLGAFATEDIDKGDVIGEYIGEFLDDMEETLNHRGLNYTFELGNTTVDAQWLGNPTRFLNDSMPKRPNCEVDPLHIVHDERRLIMRATKKIKQGQELTLSYGDAYWGKDKNTPKEQSPLQ
ncbi:hypothetical protein C8R43DRAFT_141989 [Mycena crocata]|nr:hypothetical protein C8R43DRAFT_141989 [Mycena crocata]